MMFGGLLIAGSEAVVDGHPGAFVGENYGGGIIIYVDPTGAHGLIMSTTDIAGLRWNNGTSFTIGGTSQEYGTGAVNTGLIIAAQGAGSYAAAACVDYIVAGFDDWFLPSVVEAQYISAHTSGTHYYWTSSEVNSANAYRINSWNNYASSTTKAQTGDVRAVRYF